MNSRLKQNLLSGAALVLALVAGWQIAHESFALAGLVGGVLLLWLGSWLARVEVDALVAGLVLGGYLVGNRGFAQLNVPGVPLLPGELALGLGLVLAIFRAAWNKVAPLRRDALNMLLLLWLAAGAARLRFDVPAHGFLAVRDFAMLYYALFFFLAQGWAGHAVARRWIERCLTAGFVLAGPVFLAFARWPAFFADHFTVGGIPLIYVKSDVEGGLLVAGTCWFLERYHATRRRWWLVLMTVSMLAAIFSNSRAALLALVLVFTWLLVFRDWRRLQPCLALVGLGVLSLVVIAAVSREPLRQSAAYRLYESAISMVDVQGTGVYESPDLADKPDNNTFRRTWWLAVIEETLTESPWFGLGFGYDLADQFVRIYYTEAPEDFSARSPHNFLLTVFGRTGFVGLGLLLLVLGAMSNRTWRAGRAAVSATGLTSLPLWLGAWGILASSCFGVVLEGPMGAVVFWTLLGLANGTPAKAENGAELPAADPKSAPTLPSPAASA